MLLGYRGRFDPMIGVAVFDDHAGRRAALEVLLNLQHDMHCCGTYGNCSGIVAALAQNPPQVVLMDVDMPEVNGIEGVRLLRRHYPEVFIIMQTVFDEDTTIFDSILAGANGYVLKGTPPEKLTDAIREVVQGGAPMTPSIARRTLELFRNTSKTFTDEAHDLSAREVEVLALLAKGHSQKSIATELFLSVYTVNNHVKKIYQKLKAHKVSEAVSIALKRGIVGP